MFRRAELYEAWGGTKLRRRFESGTAVPHSRTLARSRRLLDPPTGFGVRRTCAALNGPSNFHRRAVTIKPRIPGGRRRVRTHRRRTRDRKPTKGQCTGQQAGCEALSYSLPLDNQEFPPW